jgi:hypothetical protein
VQIIDEYYIGLEESSRINILRFQEKERWCWAASTQMVLLKHGIDISQEILSNILTSDELCYPNCPNSFKSVAKLLDGQELNNKIIHSFSHNGELDNNTLISEISSGNPLIIGVMSKNNDHYGHAVVLTNLKIIVDSVGNRYISKLFVLDPLKTQKSIKNKGLRFYEGEDIPKILRNFLIIRTSLKQFY